MSNFSKRLHLKISSIQKKSLSSPRGTKSPYRINSRRNTPRHILIKLTRIKQKERILKATREKQQATYKENPIHLTADLSVETLQARRKWQDIFKVLKGKSLQPRLPSKDHIIIDGEIKSFSDKQKLRELSTTKPALQQMLKDFYGQEIQAKKKIYKIKPQTIKKMAIVTYISIIALNVN